MTAYRRVYDSRHLQADCQEPGSAPKLYALQSSMGCFFSFTAAKQVATQTRAMTNERAVNWVD